MNAPVTEFSLPGYPLDLKRIAIEAMDPLQVVKLSFCSEDAAADVRDADIRPNKFLIDITECYKIDMQFGKDGPLIRWIFPEKYRPPNFVVIAGRTALFPVKLATGHVLENCFQHGYCYRRIEMGCVVAKENVLRTVQLVYNHFCFTFPNPKRSHIKIGGDHFSAASWLLHPRRTKQVNELILEGTWKKEDFEKLLHLVEFKTLWVTGSMPLDARMMPITTDRVRLTLENDWLTEERLMSLDAKQIQLDTPHSWGQGLPSAVLTDQYNTILKLWSTGKAFDRMEALELQTNEIIDKKIAYGGLTMKKWNKERRPEYAFWLTNRPLCGMGVDSLCQEDVVGVNGRLGTEVLYSDRGTKFIVWKEPKEYYLKMYSDEIESNKKIADQEFKEASMALEVAREKTESEKEKRNRTYNIQKRINFWINKKRGLENAEYDLNELRKPPVNKVGIPSKKRKVDQNDC